MKSFTHNKPSNWRPIDHLLLTQAINKPEREGREYLEQNEARPRVRQAFEAFAARVAKAKAERLVLL